MYSAQSLSSLQLCFSLWSFRTMKLEKRFFFLKKNCALVGQKLNLYYLQLRHKYRLYYLEGTHYREMLRKSFILIVFGKNIPAVSQNLISICLFDLTAVMETNTSAAKEHTLCAEPHSSERLHVLCHLTSSQTSGWSLEMEMYIPSYHLFIEHWLLCTWLHQILLGFCKWKWWFPNCRCIEGSWRAH